MFEIKGKFGALILTIVVLNTLVTGWNFGLVATNPINSSSRAPNLLLEPRSNGGINWSQIEVLSEPVLGKNSNVRFSGKAEIAVEGNKIYVVWQDANNTNGAGTDWDILYRHFDGNLWTDIQVISEPVLGDNRNIQNSWSPTIAVENGKIYVVWWDFNNTNGAGLDQDIFFRCNLTGSSWEPVQVISEPVYGQNFNTGSGYSDIAVEDGKIYAVWVSNNNTNGAGTDADIFFRCNLTGSSWEPVQVISEPLVGYNITIGHSMIPRMAVENGKIYVVWYDSNNTNGAGADEDIFFRCNLTGLSWEPIQVISEPVVGQNFNDKRSEYPSIVVEYGKIYVVWCDLNNMNNAGIDWDIFYRCNLTGTSWEPIQVISEPVVGQNFNAGGNSHKDITVENGRIYVVWASGNNTNGSGTDSDIFFRCNLTGSSWEPVQVISEPVIGKNFNTELSNYPNVVTEKNNIYVVWTDYNDTNCAGTDRDIFFRWKFIVPPSLFLTFPKVTPKAGNTSTEFNFIVKYYQLNNTSPSKIKVIIHGIEHSMLEVDQSDTNYTNGKKYYFSIKNLDIGTHAYEFNASDGINYINTRLFHNLKVINSKSKIMTEDNLTAIEDEYYEVTYEFEDIDIANVGQVCQWEFETNASWLNFNDATGELSGTPGNDDVGKYWVYIAVNDTVEIVFTNFTLKVIDVNDDPIIDTPNVKLANEDELYEVDYNAIDIDSPIKHQIWSLETNSSSWLNISPSSGILNGTPGNDNVGEYWINVTVNDNEGGFDFTNFTLIVQNVNDRPEIITEDILTAETDKLYEVQYNATDIDSVISKFSWSLITNATWLSIDPVTGVLSGIPTRLEAGLFVVNVTVSDGDGGIDWQEFILTVYKGNLPPMITTEDISTARVNKSYEVDYNAIDDRTHPNFLSWLMETNASWLSIDSTTGILSGTSSSSDSGKQYWVNVSVYDLEFGLDYQNFTLKVLKEPKVKNYIPILMNFKLIPNEGDTETEFTFTVSYFDQDNEKPIIIQVVIDGIAYDMNLKTGKIPYNGKYEYKTKLSNGTHSYYYTASDGKDTNTSAIFTTPNIEKPGMIKDDGTEREGIAWEWLILVIVIAVIIALILIFLMIKRKKREPETIHLPQPVVQELIGESSPPPTPQEPSTPAQSTPVYPEQPEPIQAPPFYPEYQPEEPVVQGDLNKTPGKLTPVPIMPDYTTPEKPEPVQSPEEEGIDE